MCIRDRVETHIIHNRYIKVKRVTDFSRRSTLSGTGYAVVGTKQLALRVTITPQSGRALVCPEALATYHTRIVTVLPSTALFSRMFSGFKLTATNTVVSSRNVFFFFSIMFVPQHNIHVRVPWGCTPVCPWTTGGRVEAINPRTKLELRRVGVKRR